MEKQNFEEKLTKMRKPEISDLKHQDLLSDAILNAKDKSVVGWWWLCIPLFIILMLLMKSFFMPGTTLLSNLHELTGSQKYMSLVFFMITPIIMIIVNALTIRKIYILSGSPKSLKFLELVWFNIAIVCVSALILIFYLL